MSEQAQPSSVDERRLAFEERKWADELSLRQLEQETRARENTWRAKLFSPLTATIMVGILTVVGSVTATLLQNSTSLELEKTKFQTTKLIEEQKFSFSKTLETQKQQHELILKMISVDNVEQARSNLQFLAEAKLLADEALATRLTDAAANAAPLIRPPNTPIDSSDLRNCLQQKPGAREKLMALMTPPLGARELALMLDGKTEGRRFELMMRAYESGVC